MEGTPELTRDLREKDGKCCVGRNRMLCRQKPLGRCVFTNGFCLHNSKGPNLLKNVITEVTGLNTPWSTGTCSRNEGLTQSRNHVRPDDIERRQGSAAVEGLCKHAKAWGLSVPHHCQAKFQICTSGPAQESSGTRPTHRPHVFR